ncbi:saccharopine dehydrogenase related protein [Lactobacillus selangorensis]|uniref:Saccharopine dehydrogenase related protein n=2 Tax=Lactobacillus selangorensis TaxID=81857 RepID=A0A0R2G6V3_9LACO|nr:NAD(P)H-binding protein [Lactobacillus selangorensis]KRN28682.1 saccharopine dehydrogenase related protein [Lactobacillus selangorensis]KRN32908.1 saccharopine dehydrogenase related protein [Lactobacillus selangorensis]
MNILILGATGQIAHYLITDLLNHSDADLTLFGHHTSSRLTLSNPNREKAIDGDIENANDLKQAMKDQNIVILDNAMPNLLEDTYQAMKKAGVTRLIVTGTIGLYDEVGGKFGEWGKSMSGAFKDSEQYQQIIQQIIDDPEIDFTYVRMTMLYNNDQKTDYKLVPFGEKVTGAQVSRQAVAHFITDMVNDPTLENNANIAIIEPGSEDMTKPSFY